MSSRSYDVTVEEKVTYVVSVYAGDAEYAQELAEEIAMGFDYAGPYGMRTKGKDVNTISVERVEDHAFDT